MQTQALDEAKIVSDMRRQLFRGFALAALRTPYPEPRVLLLPGLSRLVRDVVSDEWLEQHVVPHVMHWQHRLRDPARVRSLLHDEIEDRRAAAWDDALDAMGLGASDEQLAEHLARAPERASQRHFLAGYLAARALHRLH